MKEFEKNITISEGPFERISFPSGVETHDVLSRVITTTYIQDGYLCEKTVTREYRDGDYHDQSSSKRIIKLDG
jgi:hypothetical protein|tara:strand:- start:427 stop:645 length:219 start_codon:yes stop_codon:yes gene_type:complete